MQSPLIIYVNGTLKPDVTTTITFNYGLDTGAILKTKIEEAILFLKSSGKINKNLTLEKVENMYVEGTQDNILLEGPIRIDPLAGSDIKFNVYLKSKMGGRKSRRRKTRKNKRV